MTQTTDAAWRLVRAAATAAAALDHAGRSVVVREDLAGGLVEVPPGSPDGVLAWHPGRGWTPLVDRDPRRAALDLYLPLCSASTARPIAVGHLGQSLDGFIATHSGDSQFVTGSANIVHLHRMRALCDAVIVGSGTVAADDPQLTTRHVSGPNPLRVVFDPARRLDGRYRLFHDDAAPTLYMCARALIGPDETHLGQASIVPIDADDSRSPEGLAEVLAQLRARGGCRFFVEGGGVTVSAFLQASLLDRLHVAIAPLLIGDGKPAIRLAPQVHLRDCRRPQYRVFRMGGDMLFDCDLHTDTGDAVDDPAQLTRII